MRRLKDPIDGSEGGAEARHPDDAVLGRLMRSAGPLPESEVRLRRVLRAVHDRTRARPTRMGLRAALAALVLLLVGGVAGATIGRAAWDRFVTPSAAPSPSLPSAPIGSSRGARPALALHDPAPAPPAEAAPEPLADPALAAPAVAAPAVAAPALADRAAPEAAPSVAAVAPAGHARPLRRSDAAARVVPAAPDDSALLDAAATRAEAERSRSTLLLVAIKALRTDHDPERAQVLLEDYLRVSPDGPLVEQAMLLQIAAAVALDDPQAAVFARRYLARFPEGRSRAAAEQAIARFGSRAP